MEYDCLVIDDELTIAKTITEYFNMFDINTVYVTSYDDGIAMIKENQISLIVLDVNLGEKSGFQLCKQIREFSDVPILFISARTSDQDILTALNIGGDDYITKPFTLNILSVKVKNMLSRYKTYSNPSITNNNIVKVSLFTIDYSRHEILANHQLLKLKEQEYKVLLYLLENPNRVISKEEFFNNVWDDKYIGEGSLTVHIWHIRSNFEKQGISPEYIKTIWGIGYMFEENCDEKS